ncbi:hypothetical protein GCM10007421_18830 [Halopseudomonas oceani]|nr:hypothetical protein GCM10007421_18830 [Halopseudomonas oceani]
MHDAAHRPIIARAGISLDVTFTERCCESLPECSANRGDQQTADPGQTGENGYELVCSVSRSALHPWAPETGLLPYHDINPITVAGKAAVPLEAVPLTSEVFAPDSVQR